MGLGLGLGVGLGLGFHRRIVPSSLPVSRKAHSGECSMHEISELVSCSTWTGQKAMQPAL